MDEAELVSRYLDGDLPALQALVKRHQRNVFSFLMHLTGDRDRAEDLFQETFLKAMTSICTYDEQQKFGSWLIRIAHSIALDDWRKVRRQQTLVSSDNRLVDLAPDGRPNPEIAAERSDLLAKVHEAVSDLPEKQRTVFLLRQHGDLKFREIAEITGEPIGTVLSHMRYAVQRLRTALSSLMDDVPGRSKGSRT